MNRVQPRAIKKSANKSDGKKRSFRKNTENKVLKIIDKAILDETRNWFPTFNAMMLRTCPTAKTVKPRIQIALQIIGLFAFDAGSCSLLMWAYFIRTSPAGEKILASDAKVRHVTVSLCFSGNLLFILALI